MATKHENNVSPEEQEDVNLRARRVWQEFAIRGYAQIVARKHDLVVPLDDIPLLSDEELAARLRLISDLAHLPPA